jgi:glycosyltransferase involved in cell wall biosynthesis
VKVCHVIPTLDARAGGPPRALVGLSRAQHEAGLEVTVVTGMRDDTDDRLIRSIRSGGVEVRRVGPMVGRSHPDLAPTLDDAITQSDVVHIHALWDHIQHVAAATARRRRTPYVFRPCGMLDPWSLGQSRLKKQIYLALRLRRDLQHAAALHYTTTTERDLAGPLGLMPQAIVEPNGIDRAEFDPPPPPDFLRQRFPALGDRPIVLFLSRLHHKKGPDVLIEAFAKARPRDAALVLAGPGEEDYVSMLRGLIDRHGLADRVVFTGMLNGRDRIAALADADLFCLPSHQENFGIAVVEALAAGTPVLISDQVNIHEEVTAAGVGEATPLTIDSTADALHRWMTDPARRRDAAQHAAAFAFDRYAWHQIAHRWRSHYDALIAASGTSVRP